MELLLTSSSQQHSETVNTIVYVVCYAYTVKKLN